MFTVRQALDCGMSRDAVARRQGWGWYRRVGRGVYLDVAVTPGERSRRFAALLGVGFGAVLARETAGVVHGLASTPRSDDVHLVLNCTCRHQRPEVTVHRSLTLRPHHQSEVDGYPVTTVARTLADLAAVSGPVRLRRLVAESIRRELTTPAELEQVMEEMGRFRGKVALRAIVEEASPLDVGSRSALESEFLALVVAAGLPPSAMNHPVVDAGGVTRWIDAVYLPQRLPVELDSRLAHGSLLDWGDDLRRENAIVLQGWRPFLRFNWWDVTRHGHLVVSTIRRALAAG